MTTLMKGTIHGKLIELDREPGLPEGQEVAVILQPILPDIPFRKEVNHELPKWEGKVLGKLTREEIYDDGV